MGATFRKTPLIASRNLRRGRKTLTVVLEGASGDFPKMATKQPIRDQSVKLKWQRYVVKEHSLHEPIFAPVPLRRIQKVTTVCTCTKTTVFAGSYHYGPTDTKSVVCEIFPSTQRLAMGGLAETVPVENGAVSTLAFVFTSFVSHHANFDKEETQYCLMRSDS
jgi:hypothetical protein